MVESNDTFPDWLASSEQYRPDARRDGYLSRNLLALSSLLSRLRLDDGQAARFSPSAPAKLFLWLGCILLVSLSRNLLFVLVVAAALLVRVCLLPRKVLGRIMGGASAAALFTALVMTPAMLLGQPTSAAMLAVKAFVCTGITLTCALTSPPAELTSSLRSLHVPAILILTLDLTLRSIVRLGETAAEVLVALSLRSVGRNRNRNASMGGVGGVVLLKAARASEDTYDAMRCRGFDGSYRGGGTIRPRALDLAWLAAFGALVLLFLHLQGAV